MCSCSLLLLIPSSYLSRSGSYFFSFSFALQTLEAMEDAEFSSYVEALATKKLDRPKNLGQQCAKYWAEIVSQHHHFHRLQTVGSLD